MKNYKNKGFSLIEVMVAIAIFMIIMTGVYAVFESQQKSYVAQREVAAMQQNLRASMYMISRDVRLANCYLGKQGLGWYDQTASAGSEWGFISGIESWDNFDGEGSDVIDIVYANFACKTPMEPKNNGDYMPTPSAESNVGTDSMPDSQGDCPPTNSKGRSQECFKDDDLVVVSNGVNSNLMQVTNVQGGNAMKLQHHPTQNNINVPANKNWPHDGYGAGTTIFKVKYVSYKIKKTDPLHPSLSYCGNVFPTEPPDQRNYQPIAENIEDLQFGYVFDDGSGGTFEDNEITDITFPNLRSVRISIVARSDRAFNYYKGKRPGLENNPGGSEDNYMRRVYTAEVEARNLRLDVK